MIRICISGLTASGKTTIGEALSKELNILHVTKTVTKSYKAAISDKSLNDDQKLIETAIPKYANDFDREVADLAEKNESVVTTWLGPWMVKKPTLCIWLNADLEDRIVRHAQRYKLSPKAANASLLEKDRSTINTFKKVYNINVTDTSKFDLQINTSRIGVSEAVSLISMLALLKEKENDTFR